MKTFKELCEMYNNIKVIDSYDIERKYREDRIADVEKAYNDKKAAYVENEKNEIQRKIILHNAKCTFIAEYIQPILDIYNKYAGKRIGNKTRDKIRDATNELLKDVPAHVYIDTDGINYSVLNINWERIWFKYENGKRYTFYDSDGKMNKLEMSMFHDVDMKYIEDTEKYIAMKTEQADKIKELSILLEKARKEYSDNLCDGFATLDYGKTNTYFTFR